MSIILKPSALKVKDDNGNYIGTNMFAAESTQEYLDAIETIGTQTQTAISTASTQAQSAISTASTQAQSAISTASTQAQSAMEAKAEQTIESIPEDYTELAGDVTELKADFSLLENNTFSIFNNGNTLFNPSSFRAGAVNLLNGSVSYVTPPCPPIIDKHSTMVKLFSNQVKVSVVTGYKIRGAIYNSDGSYSGYFNWISDASSYPSALQNIGGKFIRAYAMKSDESNLTQAEYDALTSVYSIECENVTSKFAIDAKSFVERTQTNGNYTDFNSITTMGAYLINSALQNGFNGSASEEYRGTLLVSHWRTGNGYGLVQIYYNNDPNKVYFRNLWMDQWGAWNIVATSQNIKLYGAKIANFGDSIFGNKRPPNDISTALANLTGATVYNLGFGGCRMSKNDENWDAFSMYRLAYAVANNDYSVQNAVDIAQSGLPSYFTQTRTLLESLDFDEIDVVTISYGTNDFTAGVPLSNNSNPYDTETFEGALRYSLELLLSAYPQLKIFVCTPTYRFWMENGVFVEDSDTKIIAGQKLTDFVSSSEDVAKEYHLTSIDNYYKLGINKFNRSHWFPENDGTHHNKLGAVLIAQNMENEMF